MAQGFEDALGIPVRVTNDANAAAMGEMTYGVARGIDTLVVHTVNDEYSLFAIYGKRPSESVKYSTWGVRRQR